MIDKNFYTSAKIVGVTQFNDNKYPIQMILPNLNSNDKLFFLRDYGNKYDENAIKVYVFKNKESKHIGYISKELAAKISPFLEENPTFDLYGKINEITGGTAGKSYGCNIDIWIQDPDEPSHWEIEAFQEWLATQKDGVPKAETSHTTNSYTAYNKNQKKTNTTFWISFTVSLLSLLILLSFSGIIAAMNEKEAVSSNEDSTVLNSNNSQDEVINEPTIPTYEPHIQSNETDSYSVPESSSNKITPVKMSELDITYTILPPNSIGTVWMEAKYTNNSKYTILSFSLTVLLKDKNDKTYLSCYDTVLPGETSPIFDTFGPDSQLQSDIDFLKCSLRVLNEKGESFFIDYDYKLNTYNVLGDY